MSFVGRPIESQILLSGCRCDELQQATHAVPFMRPLSLHAHFPVPYANATQTIWKFKASPSLCQAFVPSWMNALAITSHGERSRGQRNDPSNETKLELQAVQSRPGTW